MPKSNTINDLFFFGEKEYRGDFGVELEVEGSGFPDHFRNSFWAAEIDGSLRGDNREYVLKSPQNLDQVNRALTNIKKYLKDKEVNVKCSDRTGTHVHINCLDLTSIELINFLTTYYVLEELIVSTCGPNRQGNHFCFRAVDADAGVLSMCQAISNNNFTRCLRDTYRYSALNFLPITKFGSLEFRALQTDPEFSNVIPMCKILLSIKLFAKDNRNPQEIVNNFSGRGFSHLANTILGEENWNYVRENSDIDPDYYDEVLERGIRITQDLAFSKKDWESFTLSSEVRKSSVRSGVALAPIGEAPTYDWHTNTPTPAWDEDNEI